MPVPETLLGPMVAAVLAGGFALLGVLLNQRGAQRLATTTLLNQRTLARDEARRTWRREVAQPFLTFMDRRGNLSSQLERAVYEAQAAEVQRLIVELSHQLPPAYSHLAIADAGFQEALKRCSDADTRVYALVRPPADPTVYRDRIGGVVHAFRQSVIDLHAAAENYCLALDSVPAAPPQRGAPWWRFWAH